MTNDLQDFMALISLFLSLIGVLGVVFTPLPRPFFYKICNNL
jgi:hypothetical protein